MKIESKIVQIPKSEETVYNFISDFNNFGNFVPSDKAQDFESTTDTCSFTVPGLGKAGLKIIEREPFKLIKITNEEGSPMGFNLWIQLKNVAENDTRIKVTIEPKVNPMMQMMVKKPLKEFVDKLVDQMQVFHY